MKLWLLRGGEKGCFEKDSLNLGLAITNWSKLGDFSKYMNKDEIRSALIEAYPNVALTRINKWNFQIRYFRGEISIGDLLAMPIKYQHFFRIGEVIGDYQYLSGSTKKYKHVRKVKWLEPKIKRPNLDDDLRNSLNYHGTICAINKERAAQRILEML
jgi:restriction system protein